MSQPYEYDRGLRASINCASASIAAASSCSNYVYNFARQAAPSGAEALSIKRLAEDLEQAARTLREAAGLAYKPPALMAAE